MSSNRLAPELSMALVLAVLAVVACAQLIVQYDNASAVTASLWASLFVSFAGLFYFTLHPGVGPIALCGSFYFAVCFVLPGVFHVATGYFPFFNAGYSHEAIAAAGGVILLFSACFSLGYFGPRLTPYRPVQAPMPKAVTPLQQLWLLDRRLPLVIGLCSAASLICASAAGWEPMLMPRGEISEVSPEPTDLILQSIARSASFIGLWLTVVFIRSFGWSLARSVLLAAVAALFLATNSPLAIPRFLLAAYVIAFYFLLMGFSVRSKMGMTLLMFTSVFTVFPLVNEVTRGDVQRFLQDYSLINYLSEHADFDGLQSTLTCIEWISSDGYQSGRQLASSLLFFVPRSFWPTKSIGTGGDAAGYLGFPFLNLSAPLPVEFFVDFGWLGLAVLSLLFGKLIRLLEPSDADRAKGAVGLIEGSVGVVIAGYIIILMRGSLVAIVGPVAVSLVLAWFGRFLLLRRL